MRKLWNDLGSEKKPQFLKQEKATGFPDLLKKIGKFCLNRNKVPFQINGSHAFPNDASTFVDYETAKKNAEGYDGISLGLFDLPNGFHLCCIDIDDCVDSQTGEIAPIAKEILNNVSSYAEYSPSGTGIHIFFGSKDTWDSNQYYTNKRNVADGVSIEIYSSATTNKVIRISEKPIEGTTSEIFRQDISWLLDKYMWRKSNTTIGNKSQDYRLPESYKAGSPKFKGDISDWCKVDDKLNTLYNDTSHSKDESAHDMALCCKIAFWTGKDTERIDSVFRQSPWYESKDGKHKEKWAVRNDYRNNTIDKALQFVRYDQDEKKDDEDAMSNNFTYDDTGNAKRFAWMFGQDVRFNVENKVWMVWNGNFWQSDQFGKIRDYVDKMIEDCEREAEDYYSKNIKGKDEVEKTQVEKYKMMSRNVSYLRSKRGKDNCLSEAEHIGEIPMTNSMFDTLKSSICTKNGTVDLKTGEMRENRREDFFTRSTPFSVDFHNKPKQFLNFINTIIKKHPEMFDFLHRLLGYCLTDETVEQKIFFLYGDGNDGKSVLLDVVSNVIGDYSGIAKKDLIMDGNIINHNENSLARLRSRRLVWIDEVSPKDRLNEGMVKNITSGTGEVSARFLYANEFTYRFTGKIIVTTNYEPKITGVDRGIWRRIIMLPFDLGLKEDEVDRNLKEKLISEAGAILAWLISGAVDYYRKGLSDIPLCSLKMTEEYKEESDEVQQWIDEDTEETLTSIFSKSSELYDDFVRWCKRGNQYVLSQTMWGKSMRKKFKKSRIDGQTIYYGIILLEDKAIDESKALLGRAMAEDLKDEDSI